MIPEWRFSFVGTRFTQGWGPEPRDRRAVIVTFRVLRVSFVALGPLGPGALSQKIYRSPRLLDSHDGHGRMPQALQVVVPALRGPEEVDDHVPVVHQDPAAVRIALAAH